MDTMEPSFDGLTYVGEQVPSIGDLQRPGCTEADASGIFGRTVSGNDPDVGPPFEPAGQRRRGAIREEVDHAVAIEVNHDRAVAAAFPHRPVVDADVDGRRRVGHRHGPDEPQHGRAARWHAQVLQQTCTARAAAGDADPALRFTQPPRARARGSRSSDGDSAKVRRWQDGLQQ